MSNFSVLYQSPCSPSEKHPENGCSFPVSLEPRRISKSLSKWRVDLWRLQSTRRPLWETLLFLPTIHTPFSGNTTLIVLWGPPFFHIQLIGIGRVDLTTEAPWFQGRHSILACIFCPGFGCGVVGTQTEPCQSQSWRIWGKYWERDSVFTEVVDWVKYKLAAVVIIFATTWEESVRI